MNVLGVYAKTWYVTPTGAGGGTSWSDAASLATAMTGAATDDELWLKAGTYTTTTQITATKALTLRGGFAGTESSASERTSANGYSVIDGEMIHPTNERGALIAFSVSSGTVRLERIEIKRSLYRGIMVTGGISAVFDDCRIIDNGYKSDVTSYSFAGRGIYATGSAKATLVITNCAIEGNIDSTRTAEGKDNNYNNSYPGHGAGLYAKTFASVSITDSSFVTNGVPNKVNGLSGRDITLGFALYAEGAPIKATRVKFIGNGSICHGNCGGIVFLNGACGGSSFSNCLFMANFARPWNSGSGGSRGGALVANLSSATDALSLGNCTFAYNYFMANNPDGSYAAAGLMMMKGAATVKNSIFYGNLARKGNYLGADAYCSSAGSIAFDNCFVTDHSDGAYVRNNGGTVTFSNMHANDPELASDKTAFTSMLSSSTSITWPYSTSSVIFKHNLDLTTLDAHLKSTQGRWNGADFTTKDTVTSPAIDAATGVDVGLEKAPNGDTANCGAYGRTVEASMTPIGEPKIGDDFAIEQASDYTQPHVSFTMAGSGDYTAAVYIHCGLTQGNDDGTGWDKTLQVELAATNGQAIASGFKRYFVKDDYVYYRVRVVGKYGSDAKSGGFYITGDTPPWHGKKGPSNVIHVRYNPGGSETGESWDDAVSTLADGLALLSATKNEIWIAGDQPTTKDFSILTATTIRGGFNNYEESAADRVEGAVSVFDAGTTVPASGGGVFKLTASSGTYVLDGIEITRSKYLGIVKSGASSLTLIGCRLTDNFYTLDVASSGRGLRAEGSASASRLVITNCQFIGNREHEGHTAKNNYVNGSGAYVKNFLSAEIVDTLFLTNGFKCITTSAPGRDGSHGGAIYVENAPTRFVDCRFIGNGTVSHNANGGDGGAVYLTGTSGGSSFTNCEWTGNFEGWFGGSGIRCGALVINLSTTAAQIALGNCTFAFNMVCGATSDSRGAAGLHCVKGAVSVTDSIFYGNVFKSGSGCKADVYVTQSATCAIANCMFETSEDARYYAAESGYDSKLTLTDCRFADPLMATNRADFIRAVGGSSSDGPSVTSSAWLCYKNVNIIPTLDTRLRSYEGRLELLTGKWVKDDENSPAIDAATLDAPYEREPAPNGERANLGSWGNTYAASKTAAGEPAILSASCQLKQDYTQPYFDVALGGTGKYNAMVYFCCGTEKPAGEGYAGWERVVSLAATNGSVLATNSRKYYEPGTTVYWRIYVESANCASLDGTLVIPADAQVAPWHGKKGPANVVHVRSDATGLGDGTSWSDATSLPEAVKLMSDTKNEIWIGENVTNDAEFLVVPVKSFTIHGGFSDEWETSVDSLKAGRYSTVDAGGYNNCLKVAPNSGNTVKVVGVRFTNSSYQGLYKSGAGNLIVENSLFERCGNLVSTIDDNVSMAMPGRGICAYGTKDVSGLTVSNCVFRGNLIHILRPGNNSGCGIYISGAKDALVVDSLFETNCVAKGHTGNVGARDGTSGGALSIGNAPNTLVLRSRFVGNGCPCHANITDKVNTENIGSAAFVYGESDGTKFENCQFVGNFALHHYPIYAGSLSASVAVRMYTIANGHIVDKPDWTVAFDKCTFAYNFMAPFPAGGSGGVKTTGGLMVLTGTAAVKNSIFWQNFVPTNASIVAAADVIVCNGATATFDYTLFKANSTEYLRADSSGTLTLAETCLFDEAQFMTSWSVITAQVTNASAVYSPLIAKVPLYAKTSDPTVIDVHVPMFSKTIDAGDPTTNWRQEPKPNGRRVNLGAFGGTREATFSPYGLQFIVR